MNEQDNRVKGWVLEICLILDQITFLKLVFFGYKYSLFHIPVISTNQI